jgi:hypothetical protein
MSTQKAMDINLLLGRFLDLQEQWEEAPADFDWPALRALAADGAHSYNEGNGPSFQILCIDGMRHGEFHLRFLEYSVEAGFDPFKLVVATSGTGMVAVFGHESLADAANENAWSGKIQASLRELARARFGAAIEDESDELASADFMRMIECCRDSIPDDLLAKVSDRLHQHA